MPTYNYKCDDCGHIFSAIQSIKAEPLQVCQECGGSVNRVISGGMGLIFKGSGFYITDYAKSNAYKSGEKIKKTSKNEKEVKTGSTDKKSTEKKD